MERLGRVALDDMRYTRQTMLSEVGEDGQRRLSQSATLIVGAGGLGAPILLYLASAGVGHIGIVDGDSVSESNLNRQVLYTETDLGKRKAPAARERLRQLNGTLRIDAYDLYLSQSNALAIATGYDLIIDACDNLPTRHLLDTTSEQLGIPYLYGAVEGFVGQTALFAPGGKVRYRDLFPPGEDEQGGTPVGILGATAGTLGALMASQAIRYLLGLESSLTSRLWRLNLSSLVVDQIALD